jgi:hypothetical protein
VEIRPQERSYTCAFCSSTFVLELPGDRLAGPEPEFVLPFVVPPEQAKEQIDRFLKRCYFIPTQARRALQAEQPRGVYIPCWHFALLAESTWSAQIGEHYYENQTYTVWVNGRPQTRTRRVQKTEWWDLSGKYHRYWSGYLVTASRALKQEDLEAVMPFNLEALKRYRPTFLAGWFAENCAVPREQALLAAAPVFHNLQEEAIRQFLPGDTHRHLKVQTELGSIEPDLVLVPLYILTVRWGQDTYRLLVNGQTGKVAGRVPRDSRLIALVVLAVVLLVAAFVIALLLLFRAV